jgi:arylsulfatase A-like enzyme
MRRFHSSGIATAALALVVIGTLATVLGCPPPRRGRPNRTAVPVTSTPSPQVNVAPDAAVNEAVDAPMNTGARLARRPNVVVVLTDDQRWDCLGGYEKPFLGMKTPNLDRLAAEGARFRNMFVTTSLCSPARASYLSGLYAHSHGVLNNFTDYPLELPSYPRRLQGEGYATAYIGKWHMGEDTDDPRPGFDYWASHKGQGKYYDTEFNINGQRSVLEGYYTVRVTDLAVDWLEGRQGNDQPFMLILGHKAPHGPFMPEEKYKNTYDDIEIPYPATSFQLEDKPKWYSERLTTWHGIYGSLYGFRENVPDTSPEGVSVFGAFVRSYTGTINSVDDSVGRLYDTLAELNVLDNTVFIFASDNSFLLGEHGMIDKRTMHEESIRVPLLVRYPPLVKPGMLIDEQVLNIDLAPSIVDICAAQPLGKVHGRSFKQLLQGNAEGWRTAWYYEYNYEKQFPYTPNVRGVRTKDWKYIHFPHGDGGPDRHMAELYHLAVDPQETKNLVNDPAHADKIAELSSLLFKLKADADALPDEMPIDEGIKTVLPEKAIR